MKLGSLFDGSGGFPLAAIRAGITPVWASEVEPFPIAVTRQNIPQMKHLGDVSKINGATIEPVDVITFGSPCQDLSIAGFKQGLDGQRSGLFFEAIRIIREMREATNGENPRYAIWENVLGALSSNNGNDFHRVLSEFVAIADGGPVPRYDDGWQKSGAIVADGFSLAWRVLDARFWGVPQRRRRIFLIVDFRGQRAPEILFKRGGETRHSGEDGEKRTTASGDTHGGVKRVFENHGRNARYCEVNGACQTLLASLGEGGNNQPLVLETSKADYHTRAYVNVAATLTASDYKDPPIVCNGVVIRRMTPTECARLQGFPDSWAKVKPIPPEDVDFWRQVWDEWCEIANKQRKTEKQLATWMASPYTDNAEYKLWGNGVALPYVQYILNNLKGRDILF